MEHDIQFGWFAMWGGETLYPLGQLHADVLSPEPATSRQITFATPARPTVTPAAPPIFPARRTAVPAGNFAAPAGFLRLPPGFPPFPPTFPRVPPGFLAFPPAFCGSRRNGSRSRQAICEETPRFSPFPRPLNNKLQLTGFTFLVQSMS